MLYPGGTPTQPEIISIALSKLDIKPTEIFADIGCGSGSVSIAAARLAKQVFAIDHRDDAVFATTENIKESGITNISVIKGEACDFISDIDLDCAFVGGSKNITEILDILIKKEKVRFVVNAVRVETVTSALNIIKKNNCLKEILQIQLSRGSELAGGTMFKPENPVFLIVGGKRC